jgi:hypothetical protein
MTGPANIALFSLALAAAPLTALADSQLPPGNAHRVGIYRPPPPTGRTAKVCTGASVTVTIIDPSTGRREKRCECAPGATGILTRNAETGAEALRCLRQAGPRR